MSSKRKPPIVYRSNVARAANKMSKKSDVRSDSPSSSAFVGFQSFKDHIGMGKRLKKTLYYGRHPKTERPSLPMSELAVEIFSKAVPDGLGRIDMHYASSVSRSACISPCSMILAMAYLERLRHRNPEYLQQYVSSSDLFLVSMMVASKFLYDEGEDEEVFNDEWAVSASIDVKDLNQLERNFLAAIDWNVSVNKTTFEHLLHQTEYALAVRKSRERGWSTYTEMTIISHNVWFDSCWKLLIDYAVKVIAVSALAYTASIFTMIGATLIANQARIHLTPPPPPSPCSGSNCPTETMKILDLFLDGSDRVDDNHLVCSSPSSSTAVPVLEIQLDDMSTGLTLVSSEDNEFPFWFWTLLKAQSNLLPIPTEGVGSSLERIATSLSDRNSSLNSSHSWSRRWPLCCRQLDEETSCTATSYSFFPFVVAIS